MKFLGIRFVTVDKENAQMAAFLSAAGLPSIADFGEGDDFDGAVFEAGDSWIEVWPEAPGMPEGMMLQIVVDDADAWAEHARANGLDPQGPVDVHGDRCYAMSAPTGMPITVQSEIPAE